MPIDGLTRFYRAQDGEAEAEAPELDRASRDKAFAARPEDHHNYKPVQVPQWQFGQARLADPAERFIAKFGYHPIEMTKILSSGWYEKERRRYEKAPPEVKRTDPGWVRWHYASNADKPKYDMLGKMNRPAGCVTSPFSRNSPASFNLSTTWETFTSYGRVLSTIFLGGFDDLYSMCLAMGYPVGPEIPEEDQLSLIHI